MPDLSDIAAVILAGGKGVRLRPVVPDRLKPLAEVCGRPFLGYLLDQLRESGVRRVVLSLGHRAEMAASAIERLGDPGLSVDLAIENKPLGTAGGARLAAAQADGDLLLVMNGDSFVGCDLNAFLQNHSDRRATLSLVAVEMPDTRAYGRLDLAPDGRVAAFHEKCEAPAPIPGAINAGVYLLPRDLLLRLPAEREISLEREVFPRYVGTRFHAYAGRFRFIDIGAPERYAAAQRFFAHDA